MSVIKLKRDLQQAIANNIMSYKANYNSLIFMDNHKEYYKCLDFMKMLKIKIEDNKLLYDIDLDKETLTTLTEETMQKIKESDKKYKTENAILKIMTKNNIIIEQIFTFDENNKEDDKEYREPTEAEKNKILMIAQLLKVFNLNLELKQTKCFLSLSGNFNELSFDKKMLLEIAFLIENLDVFVIAPQYDEEDEEDEEIKGIRLFLGINLEKEK